jgi:hypothetical protein
MHAAPGFERLCMSLSIFTRLRFIGPSHVEININIEFLLEPRSSVKLAPNQSERPRGGAILGASLPVASHRGVEDGKKGREANR